MGRQPVGSPSAACCLCDTSTADHRDMHMEVLHHLPHMQPACAGISARKFLHWPYPEGVSERSHPRIRRLDLPACRVRGKTEVGRKGGQASPGNKSHLSRAETLSTLGSGWVMKHLGECLESQCGVDMGYPVGRSLMEAMECRCSHHMTRC